MGTILSVQTVQTPKFPIPSADQAYLESEKNADLNNKLDQEIKNTSNYERFNILHAQAYEDCKVRIMVAMLLGNTHTKCLDIGNDNERTLLKLGYNLSETFTHPYYHVRVNWKPKTT